MIDSFKGRWAFLSNFYPVKIEYQGIKYPSVEHYYVAMKIKDDQIINGKFVPYMDCREMISKIQSASEVKKLGRSFKLRKDWDSVRFSVMEWGVKEKFKDEKLAEMLIATGNDQIVEGNWWHDVYFGVCSCEKCGGKGENNLGKILMKVREDISSKVWK